MNLPSEPTGHTKLENWLRRLWGHSKANELKESTDYRVKRTPGGTTFELKNRDFGHKEAWHPFKVYQADKPNSFWVRGGWADIRTTADTPGHYMIAVAGVGFDGNLYAPSEIGYTGRSDATGLGPSYNIPLTIAPTGGTETWWLVGGIRPSGASDSGGSILGPYTTEVEFAPGALNISYPEVSEMPDHSFLVAGIHYVDGVFDEVWQFATSNVILRHHPYPMSWGSTRLISYYGDVKLGQDGSDLFYYIYEGSTPVSTPPPGTGWRKLFPKL